MPTSVTAGMIGPVVFTPKNILSASALMLSAAAVCGHGDVHDRINLLTQQIAQTPTNALLFFQRADLYRVDQDFTNALADLDRVTQYDPSVLRVDYCRGRILLEAGKPAEALAPLNKYLAHKPPDAEAYSTRARVLAKIGNFQKAAADYTEAIALSTTGGLDLYIERADALRSLRKPEDAIRGLDEGIRKFGPLVTLELPAIDLEVSLKHYDAALSRIDLVRSRLQRKETWLVRRAEVLHQAGRDEEAKRNYREALAAMDRLPAAHRNTRAMIELNARIQAGLGTNSPPAK